MSSTESTGANQGAGSSSNANITRTLPPESYTVGWICAIPVELRAARTFFDVEHDRLASRPKHDDNIYSLGQIGGHNVVMVCPPEYGATKVAVAASRMHATFPNLRFSLMVGIGGGIPNPPDTDIRLGDIVVSIPSERGPGVIQYDLGRETVDGFDRKGTLSKPPGLLLATVNDLRSRSGVAKSLSEMLDKAPEIEDEDGEVHEQSYPNKLTDMLFQPEYDHVKPGSCDCEKPRIDTDNAIKREGRPNCYPRIHYGNIASGSAVMKNARKRDALSKRENVICFEMEAFGLMDDFPCLVIRGICDYSDSHKNKKWQPYASSVAAAYAKRLLSIIPPEDVANLKRARNNVHWVCPKSVNPFFTGRKKILKSLRDKLCDDNQDVDQSQHRTFVIYGMGGAGKSEVCLKFAHENKEMFWGIFWIDANSIESLRRGFIDLVERAGQKTGIDYGYAKSWIENRTEKWLLIFDNADNTTIDYHEYLPSGNGSCILMTTRNDACKAYGSSGYEKFEKLEFNDAVELLLKSADAIRDQDNKELAQILVGDDFLAQHALSIVQAGAFIRKGLCRLGEYVTMFQNQRETLLRSHPDQANSIYGDVYATFEVSAAAIQASTKPESRDALELLNVLAYLHREAILEDFFTRAWNESLNPIFRRDEPEDSIRNLSGWHVDHLRRFLHPVFATGELDLVSFRNARQILLSFSLINMHPETYELSMHPLVHTWARDRLAVEEQHEAWATAAATLSLSIDDLHYREYFSYLQPHIEFSQGKFHKDSFPVQKWSTLEICRIFYHYAWVLHWQSQDTGLKNLLDLIISLESLEIPSNSLNWRHVLHLYSLCQRDLGNHAEELRLIEEVVAFDTRTMESTNPDRLNSWNNLGDALTFQGKYQEATGVLQGVVKTRQEILQHDNPDLLTSKHELAWTYASNGQPEKAIELLQDVVRIRRGHLAPTHPDRLASEHDLASAYMKNQQPERAIQLLEEVVRIRQGILAPTHPSRLASEHEFARAYYRMGRYQKALPIIEEVVRIRAEVLRPEHLYRIQSEEVLEACVSAIERESAESERYPWPEIRRRSEDVLMPLERPKHAQPTSRNKSVAIRDTRARKKQRVR